MDLSKNKIDLKSASDGVWIELDQDTSLLLARYSNSRHQAFLTKAMQPYVRMRRMGSMDEETAALIEAEGMAKHVLLGWKGMRDGDVELPYSYEAAFELLTNEQFSWFPELVRELSSDMSRFREEVLVDSVDNVKKLSSGA